MLRSAFRRVARSVTSLGAAALALVATSGLASASCVWSVVPSANAVTDGNRLFGVSADSTTDAWSVGYAVAKNVDRTLIEHWDGKHWTLGRSADVGTSSNFLYNVAAISPSDAWSVGEYYDVSNGVYQPLFETWNGKTWVVIASPRVGGSYGGLIYAVGAVSATNVWAVGWTFTSNNGTTVTLIEHWDGKRWSVVSSPNQTSIENNLAEISIVSATDIWAGGAYSKTSPGIHQTFAEHWNGSKWTIAPTPQYNASSNNFNGIAAISSTNVLATGDYYNPKAKVFQTLGARWNGTSWSLGPTPNVGTDQTVLAGLSATSATEAISVGDYTLNAVLRTYAIRWNGTGWSATSTPNVSANDNFLDGTAKIPGSTSVWAVGGTQNANHTAHQTLVEQYHC